MKHQDTNKPSPSPRYKQYEDSEAGAIQYLKEAVVSDAEEDEHCIDWDNAEAVPDPSVEGVWKVTIEDRYEGIVYLKGYPDVLGHTREVNDFEGFED